MQNLIKEKVSYFKRKRVSKALKQQEQIKIQPIQLSYTEISSQYTRRLNSRQCILQTSLMKKNPVYYNDQGYSNNYTGISSRYEAQNNPQQRSKIIGDSVKKKRINRTSKKSSSKKIKMAESITIDSYSKSSILNKLTSSRMQPDQELHYIRKNRIVDRQQQKQITIKQNQQNQTQCNRHKQTQERSKQQQINNINIPNINQDKQIKKNQSQENEQCHRQQIKNSQQSKKQQNNQVQNTRQNNQIKQQPQNKIQEKPIIIDQQLRINKNSKKQQRITCPIQLPLTLKQTKRFFYQPISKPKRHVCLLKSVSYSLKQRYLFYSSQLKLLISAQSQLGSIGSNYYFFVGQPKQKQDVQYLGKLRGNMFESNISLYTNGEHYQSLSDLDRRRQFVGNVISTKSNGQSITKYIIPKPDEVDKKLLKQKWKSLQQFEQKYPNQTICMQERKQIKTTMGMDNKQLTKRSSLSKQSIMSLQKRKVRDFQPPNRTIIDNEEYDESLIIKKVYDNLYQVTISEPWSIFQAFGVVLAKCKGKLENL